MMVCICKTCRHHREEYYNGFPVYWCTLELPPFLEKMFKGAEARKVDPYDSCEFWNLERA